MENQNRILILEIEIKKLKELKKSSTKIQKSLNLQEHIVREDILYMLRVNLASELSMITYLEKLIFWRLKERYQKSVILVMQNATSYMIKQLNSLISKSIEYRDELEAILWSINQNITEPLAPQKHKKIDLEETINRVIDKMQSYIAWDIPTLFALLIYGIFTKESELLEPSYVELMREISDMKRELTLEAFNAKYQIEEYISKVESEIEKIEESKKEQESLQKEIEEVSLFIEDINRWVDSFA